MKRQTVSFTLTKFVKPIERIKIYTYVQALFAAKMDILSGMQRLLTTYQEKDPSAHLCQVIQNILTDLTEGKPIGKSMEDAFGIIYMEESALLNILDECQEKTVIINSLVQFINLEERMMSSKNYRK